MEPRDIENPIAEEDFRFQLRTEKYNDMGKAVYMKDYRCPNCGEIYNDNDGGYIIGGIKYPQYHNEVRGSTMDGNYHDWVEQHKCEKCGTEYYFHNGAY